MRDALVFVVPFALLVSDNKRHGLVGRTIRLTREYRAAQHAVHLCTLAQWKRAGQRAPWDGDVTLYATLYAPDRRRRDAGNYRKLVTDALAHVCYLDDVQLARETWERGPIDRSNPRLVITVQPADLTRTSEAA